MNDDQYTHILSLLERILNHLENKLVGVQKKRTRCPACAGGGKADELDGHRHIIVDCSVCLGVGTIEVSEPPSPPADRNER